MNTRQIIVSLVGILLMIIVGLGLKTVLGKFKPEEKKEEKKKQKRFVEAKAVSYSDISATVNGTGRLLSFNELDLSTEVGGRLAKGSVSLKKGQSFRKGQVIGRIINDEFIYAVKAKKSRFLNGLANILPDLKVDYPDSYGKWQQFFNGIDIDNMLPDLPKIESSKEKIFLATRNILSDYYSIKADEVRLQKHTIRAPFDGSFANVFAEMGAIVGMGSRIARIIRTSAVELEVPVEMHFSQWIKSGQDVTVLDGQKKRSWKGTVVRKSKFVDPQTQAISVFVRVQPSKEQALLTGMYMYAQFPGIVIEKVMEMPRNAVYNENSVYVVDGGKLKRRTISVKKLNETTLLFAGLEEGSMLVTEPIISAKEGSQVEIIGNEVAKGKE